MGLRGSIDLVVAETDIFRPGIRSIKRRDNVVLPAPDGEDSTNINPRRSTDIVLPSISVKTILSGQSAKATDAKYVGGLGAEGVKLLQDFVKSGGTLVCIDDSCNLAIRQFDLPVR